MILQSKKKLNTFEEEEPKEEDLFHQSITENTMKMESDSLKLSSATTGVLSLCYPKQLITFYAHKQSSDRNARLGEKICS